MRIKPITLLLALFFLTNIGLSQTQELIFEEIQGLDGVTLGKINSIAQDKNGFIWLSDQGNRALLRYDGKHITKYQYDPNNPDSPDKPGGYYPECFYIEESGIMWIGFYGQGLDRYNPDTNTFTHYRNKPDNPNSLSSNFVTSIIEDDRGNLWIATYGGLDKLDRERGVFTSYNFDSDNQNSLSCDTIRSLYLDRQGTLWIGTGLAWELNSQRGGLNRYNPSTDDFTRYLHNPNDPSTLINNKVRAIFEDSRGVFWVGTGGDGLHTMDRQTGRFTRHEYDSVHPEKLSRPPMGNSTDRITFIKEDAEGYIWIGTDANGINRYNPETNKVVHITDLFQQGAWWMHISQDDQLWISTNRSQLIRVNLYNHMIPTVDGRLNSIVEESADVSWIGTNEGLIRLNKKTGEKTVYLHDPNDPNTISSNQISNLMIDSQGILWAATWFGLNRVDPATGKIKRYQHNPEDTSTILSNEITVIIEDSQSNLWIGTAPRGLDRFDPETEIFTHFQQDFNDSHSLNGFMVADIEEGKNNTIWIGLANNRGLNKLNTETGTFDLYLHGLDVFELYTDSKGVLWAATSGGGLFRHDAGSDQFISTEIKEWPTSFFEDESSNLWISTMEGVYKIYPSRDHISFFKTSIEESGDGIFENIGEAYAIDNKIKMGHWQGYFDFDPKLLVKHPDTTHVFVFEVQVNDVSDNSSSLYAFAPGITSTSLKQDQNSFSIKLIETDFQENVNDNIYFKLENYDIDWRQTPPGEWINYFKVPTGRYKLLMKSSSSSGVWTENEFNINVLPPWWFTFWAYMGYGILFVIGVFFVHRIQKSNTIRKERERIKDRELEQARRIEQAFEELKATQEQLIQSEKMASLGELTAGIAHEIQNPLNFVNNFSEVSEELLVELKDELEKGDVEEAKEISQDVIQNLKKINHHGQRASSIVKGMLEHSRTGDGEKTPADMNALADEYLRLAYHGLRAKDKSFNADFKTEFDETLPLTKIIPQDIGRVLLNLINNAFYAVNKKAKNGIKDYNPHVQVSTKKHGKSMEIVVEDNGGGIPKGVVDKIFQPFFTTKPTGEGTGLGLSLSYDIVTQGHGGHLEVETEEGIGTRFIVQLPIV